MQRLFAIICLIFIIISTPFAQAQKVLEAGTRGEPEFITIYGNTYKITPYQMSNMLFTWHDVKSFLPPEIFEAPAEPYTDEQVLEMLNKEVVDSLQKHDQMIKYYAEQVITAKPHMTHSYVDREIAGGFHNNEYAERNPKAQAIHNRFVALDYLNEMIRETLGLGSPRY